MIEFEIIESPDQNIITTFKFYNNAIYLGSKSKDLSISDLDLKPLHVLLEVPEKELLIHPMRNVDYFLLNNKRSTSIKRIKKNDLIKIGNTIIKITDFEFEEKLSKKEILTTKMNQLIEENSSLLPLIETLSNMMK